MFMHTEDTDCCYVNLDRLAGFEDCDFLNEGFLLKFFTRTPELTKFISSYYYIAKLSHVLQLSIGLSLLCSATLRQILAFEATSRGSSKLEQFFAFLSMLYAKYQYERVNDFIEKKFILCEILQRVKRGSVVFSCK